MNSPKQDAMRRARALVQAGGTASLGVQDLETQMPFVTWVNVAGDEALNPLLLISELAHHAKCLAVRPEGSLLLHETPPPGDDPMLTFRVTLVGTFEKIAPPAARQRFLDRHPYASLYVDFGDFQFWQMKAQHAHIIAGFGRAYGVRYQDIAALN